MKPSVLITGASEGIGRSFAMAMAEQGYIVHMTARNEQRLKDLMTELPGEGHEIHVADLSKDSGVEKLASLMQNQRFNLLINNAGYGLLGRFQELPIEAQLEMVNLNIKALMTLAHRFVNQAQSGDALMNVSSLIGFMPFPPQGVYAATKSFVTSFTESLWYEQKKRGVFVMGLCPGPTKSEFWTRSGGRAKDMPDYISQSPDQVVKEALHHLQKRRSPIMVSGLMNRMTKWSTSLIPRRVILSLGARTTPSYR